MSNNIIKEYFAKVQEVYKTGVATEHSYRPALEWLFDRIETGVTAVNEPKGVKVGRPDFVFQRGVDQITIGHCEAKDIDLDVSPSAMDKANKAQFDRYVKGLPNLIYTNCLDFHFYKEGELVREIKIADFPDRLSGLQADESRFEPLINQLKDFCAERLQTITSAEQLAGMMAGKAAITKDVLFNSLKEDENLQTELAGQYQAFKDQLIHDLGIEEFSDIYAETLAYGMFAARLHDDTKASFSRIEALDLLPKSNPFLKNLFGFVAGPDLDDALRRTIDELAEIFQATDLPKLFENFGSFTKRNDPFIHFYETFLAKYNPKKRKARGVWYTPEPVVNFIVRAVDDVLKTEFGLADGLADTSKIVVDWDTGFEEKGKPVVVKEELHRVQILDPAAGTGTFLAEVIKQIAPKIKNVGSGAWPKYVEENLIPRLHGFELLMASYAMCHMKLDMMLSEMGYRPTKEAPRLNVYLTNSLEEGASEPKDLFMAKWLSDEANLANDVKNKTPIMCVIGNPPYSGESANKGDWIMGLMEAYKKEPGGHERLKERNPKWINDDYVKFIRLSEHMIGKNGEGVLGFITNHGYLDNPTFRGMRWHLLKSFDKIYVLDLHGNAKKKEVSPDGSPDKNVFDIQQGVAIIIAVKKKGSADGLAQVSHGDLWGDRQGKYKALEDGTADEASPELLPNKEPQYPFVRRDFELEEHYKNGFGVREFMPVNSLGTLTKRDRLAIDFSKNELIDKLKRFSDPNITDETAAAMFELKMVDKDAWHLQTARRRLNTKHDWHFVRSQWFRPFEKRWIAYRKDLVARLNKRVFHNFENRQNLGLVTVRQLANLPFVHAFVCDSMADQHYISTRTKEGGVVFPLYVYPNPNQPIYNVDGKLDETIRVNMDANIRAEIERCAMGLASAPKPDIVQAVSFEPGKDDDGRPNEVAIFDYIYGVLHCPTYRETYKEFLKIDFPRIPYPPSPEMFWDISEKGTQLRRLHLMEDAVIGETPYPFDGEGDSVVGKPRYEAGHVFINDTQSFEDVPERAWAFYIGGYQPAQKWLKDRKGRELSFDDIRHYQKIIKILTETDRIMQTIEMDL